MQYLPIVYFCSTKQLGRCGFESSFEICWGPSLRLSKGKLGGWFQGSWQLLLRVIQGVSA